MVKIINKIQYYLWSRYVNIICSSPIFTCNARYYLYRLAGIKENRKKGDQKTYYREKILIGGRNLVIGSACAFNRECYINSHTAKITIGDKCGFGPRVSLITSTHDISNPSLRSGLMITKDINIGNGVWVCANSTILPGVNIGDGVVIAAGAVVNKDCMPNSLYGGVPAKLIKKLNT